MPRLRRPRSPVHAARQATAVLLGLAALALALRPAPPPSAGPVPVRVVVAADGLPSGRSLGVADLAVARLPPDAVPAGVVAAPAVLVGRVLAGAVRAGEPLTDARLVGPGLTAGLPTGQVAAPVRLADLAVAALVRTGDRVDVLAVADGAEGAELVAENALVLAAGSGDGDPSAGLLLVAVDPGTAGRLAVSAATATLTVSLPPP
ncbi:Flp pilus assembly protein CpaB [Blastococcus sp. TF02A-30]|uniref:Flp pilus assembly protein CpaB n=1 Tax=Blastococcus sp. TF02A-30 TaxID=2250580 RepID=UPI000DE9BD0D|nr:Flp pilus assembly protein CpaB [Blastococcus sp. TF02A-30]RBY89636.1 Flp pilus assembly protein CpaB [Blastococcus sp. TF02A-30]